MSLSTISSSLKTRLRAITALKAVYSLLEIPEVISETPCAVILAGATDYQVNLSGGSLHMVRVLILASRIDNPSSLAKLVPMIEETGDGSVASVLLADNKITEVTNNGMNATNWGGNWYLSTEFQAKILD